MNQERFILKCKKTKCFNANFSEKVLKIINTKNLRKYFSYFWSKFKSWADGQDKLNNSYPGLLLL